MKKKVSLLIFAVIFILLILFVVIYTWPKDIEQLVGDVNIEHLSAGAMTLGIQSGITYSDQWQMTEEQANEQVISDLTELLKSTKYRPSLRTLFYRNSVISHGGYSAMLSVVMEDNRPMSITFLGSHVIFSFDYQYVLATTVNKDLYKDLIDYIAQAGKKVN